MLAWMCACKDLETFLSGMFSRLRPKPLTTTGLFLGLLACSNIRCQKRDHAARIAGVPLPRTIETVTTGGFVLLGILTLFIQ